MLAKNSTLAKNSKEFHWKTTTYAGDASSYRWYYRSTPIRRSRKQLLVQVPSLHPLRFVFESAAWRKGSLVEVYSRKDICWCAGAVDDVLLVAQQLTTDIVRMRYTKNSAHC